MPIDMTDPDQAEMVRKNEQLQTMNVNLQTEINAIKTVTADGNTAIANVAVLSSENSKLKTQLEERDNKITRLTTERDAATTKYNDLDGKMRTASVEGKINEALIKCDYDPRFKKALTSMFKSDFKMDENGNVVNGEGTTVEQFFESYANTEDGAVYLSIGKQSGGASTGGNGNQGTQIPRNSSGGVINPWKKETFNRTEQFKIMRDKPDLAVRLKADAGVK